MDKIKLTIEGEPIPKGRHRIGFSGKPYTPARTQKAERMVRQAYIREFGGFQFPAGVPLEIDCRFFLKIPASASKKRQDELKGQFCMKVPDTDNLEKLVCDALNGIAYSDDKQICIIRGEKRWSDCPRTEIEIKDLSA